MRWDAGKAHVLDAPGAWCLRNPLELRTHLSNAEGTV